MLLMGKSYGIWIIFLKARVFVFWVKVLKPPLTPNPPTDLELSMQTVLASNSDSGDSSLELGAKMCDYTCFKNLF